MSKIYVVGSINMDLVINAYVMPENGMTVTGGGFMTNPGGKGANQAVAIAKSGGDVRMVGCVGSEFGIQLLDTLQGYGVDVSSVDKLTDVSSGIAVIVVSEGDNRIILDAGANARVDGRLINLALEKAAERDYLVTQLEIPTSSVIAALEAGKERGMITVLNPAPAKALPDEVWANIDYFIPNQSETEFYTGIYPDSMDKAEQAAKILRGKGVKNVVITLGSLGAVAFTNDEVIKADSFKVEAVDTTAAGDTFVGAMLVALSEGNSLKYAMTYANKASSITVLRRGAQQSIPYRSEISW